MQCSAKPAVPGSQAVETSREQVKQKQGARFSRQFWRSLHITISEPGTGWHFSAVRRSLFPAFRLREWREKMWAGKTVRGWGRECFPALWYFCAALHYMNACNRLSQADLRFFYHWMITHSLQRALDLDDLLGKKQTNKQRNNKQQQEKPKELRWGRMKIVGNNRYRFFSNSLPLTMYFTKRSLPCTQTFENNTLKPLEKY